MFRRQVTVWWTIPCKSAIPMFQHLMEQHCRDVLFVSLHALPKFRTDLGWSVPKHGRMPLRVLDDRTWSQEADAIMAERPGLHIINGYYHDIRMQHVAQSLASSGRDFGAIMEAPCNMESGLRRIAKRLLAPAVSRLRSRKVSSKAEFVLSASGNLKGDFRRLGFRADRIHPFGYFPDFAERSVAPAVACGPLRLLCIGYLEPFKGQDILIDAVALLRGRGLDVSATITGFGKSAHQLRQQVKRLGLDRAVEFAGVVSDAHLTELFETSSALVAPGREEPWGIRINEALLSGLPVVVSDKVGASELVELSGAGEVFRAGSIRSLADAMERLQYRLNSGTEIADLLRRFRPTITPLSAADFLEQVIAIGEGSDVRHPIPAWHRSDWKYLPEPA